MRSNSTWTSIVLLARTAGFSQAQDKVANQTLAELQAQRFAAADDAVDAYQAAYDAQTVTLSDLIDALNERVAAELDIAKTPADRVKALRRQVDHCEAVWSKVHQLYLNGTRGGEAKEEAHSRRELLKWQVQLKKELSKNGAGN